MTGKFYKGKECGEKQRKEETNRGKNGAIRTNETEGDGKAENAVCLCGKGNKIGRKRQEKRILGEGNGKTNEKSVNFMPERSKALAWREKKDYNGTEQDERAGTE